MSKFTLTNFGEVDSENLEEYYDAEITLHGQPIEIDITFDEKSIDVDRLKKVNDWLAQIQKLDELGLVTIKEDFKSGETVKEYIEHHLEELDDHEVKTLMKGKSGNTKEEKLLSAIKLKRIGFYPQTEERFVNLDYTLENDLTDYLVVLDFTEEGKLHYITTES